MTITYLGRGDVRRATNSLGVRSYTRTLLFKTSADSENEYHVGSHASVPGIGAVHPDDSAAYLQSIDVDNTDPKFGWTVTLNYSTERQLAENPLNDAVAITWGSEQFQRPAIFDRNSEAIVNSAGDPFDPPNMMDDSRRIVTVQKNLAVVPAWILDYQDAVNSDSFTIDGITVAAGLAKVQSVSVGEVQRRNSTTFRTVNLTIHLRREGWLLQPLDAGFREKTYGGDLINIKNPGDDELPGAPVPLDGSGVSLANPSFATCVFLDFPVYSLRAFSSLPLS